MSLSDLVFPAIPPRSEVWTYLYSGLDLARMEFADLGENERQALDQFAELVLGRLSKLAGSPEDKECYDAEAKRLEDPWFKHAVDLIFAEAAIDRAMGVLKRY